MRLSRHCRALRASPAAERPLPLTPMIDLAFLLMISIMCTTASRSIEGVIDVSQRNWVWTWCLALPSVKVEVRLREPQARQLLDRALEYRVGALRTIDRQNVETLLRRARQWEDFDGRLSIVVRAGVTTGEVVDVLEAARAAGFDDVLFEEASGD